MPLIVSSIPSMFLTQKLLITLNQDPHTCSTQLAPVLIS